MKRKHKAAVCAVCALICAGIMTSGCSGNVPATPSEEPSQASSTAQNSQTVQENTSIEELKAAEVGSKVTTGVDLGSVPDDWYKFYEDDENYYLIYGDYYKNEWLNTTVLRELKLGTEGTYNVYSNSEDNLLKYLTEENYWLVIKRAFEKVYPYREITATGAPTKEQVEKVDKEYGGLAYSLSPDERPSMLRPHPGAKDYDGCNGFWLATIDKRGSSNLFGVRCNWGGLDSNLVTNREYCVRPLVTVPKAKREKTSAEKAVLDAQSTQGVLKVGEHTIKYGDYTGSDNSTLTVNEDGTVALVLPDNDLMSFPGTWKLTSEGDTVFIELDLNISGVVNNSRYVVLKDDEFQTAWRNPTVFKYAGEQQKQTEDTGYQPYVKIVNDRIESYGKGAKTSTVGTANYLCGVPVVRLADFDGNGKKELLIAYGKDSFANTQEVFTIIDGKAVQIYKGNTNSEGGVGPYVEYVETDEGGFLLINALTASFDRGTWITFDGKDTKTVLTYESKDEGSGRKTVYKIDGINTTKTVYKSNLERFLNIGVAHKLAIYPFGSREVEYPYEVGDDVLNETEKVIAELQQ